MDGEPTTDGVDATSRLRPEHGRTALPLPDGSAASDPGEPVVRRRDDGDRRVEVVA